MSFNRRREQTRTDGAPKCASLTGTPMTAPLRSPSSPFASRSAASDADDTTDNKETDRPTTQ
jgi:hypothetical protein